MVRFGIYASGRGGGYEDLRQVWQEAERLGFDSAWIGDNVVGAVPELNEAPVFDAWSVLGALAMATHKIRIGSLVTPCGRRHPALFAKMTSIADIISGGRLNIGVGPGDEDRQFLPWGMAFPAPAERVAVLREEIEVLKLMWTEEHATYEGRYYRLEDACNSPKPLQKPHPPIWIGLATGKKLMPRLAAEYADGINVAHPDDDVAIRFLELVSQHCRDLRRDFDLIEKSRTINMIITEEEASFARDLEGQARRMGVPIDYLRDFYEGSYERWVRGEPEQCFDQLKEVIDMGFTHLIFRFGGGWRAPNDLILRGAETFANEVLPELRLAYAG
jgi:alkanesulfonate monooxygenase SsuD/methylene tetrahydromethanopterin reductase-like flavin-dependent oxidoreductase (luciferase family)